MANNVLGLVDKWISYAKSNGIKTGSTDGRPPEDTDLAAFLEQQGFKSEQYSPLLAKIPGIPSVSPEPEETELDDVQVEYLNKIKQLIKNMSDADRIQLKKELIHV